jgi:hypothetical protein
MITWTHLLLAFATGGVLGSTLSGLRFRARLRLYRRFIEDRLDSVNLPRPSARLTGVR